MVSPTPNGLNIDDLNYQYYYGYNYYAFGNGTNAALTALQTVASAAGRFGGFISIINLNSAPAYLQLFDTTATVTLGTTKPTMVIPVPSAATPANGAIFSQLISVPLANGLQIGATTTSSGATTVSTGLTGTLLYQ